MARVTRQCIESMKLGIPIQDVVAREVPLKRSGRNFVGLSPFQNEKTPSFYVLPDKGIFKDFSSGLAGDIFKFVEEIEKVTFVEAIELLAERFNFKLEYEQGAGPRPEERSLKRQLLEIHEYATDFFHQAFLADHPESNACRTYWLEQRGFSLELAKDFRIGFAPVSSQKLNERLVKQGFTIDALRASGLFYAQEYDVDPHRFRNRFRGRLMIPIRDKQGQAIAFTARQLEITPKDDKTHEAKYINSPGTPLFQKSYLVFNMERARDGARENGRLVLVEGQLDAIRCWHEGIRETIAPQGTSITLEQMKLAKRYADNLTVVLDGDKAGQSAALRMLPLAIEAGLEVHFAILPTGDDPDSFLRRDGADAFQALLSDAQRALPFAARTLLPEDPTPRDHATVISELATILAPCESEVARHAYFEEAIAVLPIDAGAAQRDFEHHLRPLLQRAAARPRQPMESLAHPRPKPIRGDGQDPSAKLTKVETELVLIVLHNERLGAPLAEVLDPNWLDYDSADGRILGWLLGEIGEGHSIAELEPRGSLENEHDSSRYFQLLAEKKPSLRSRFGDESAIGNPLQTPHRFTLETTQRPDCQSRRGFRTPACARLRTLGAPARTQFPAASSLAGSSRIHRLTASFHFRRPRAAQL